MDDDNEKPPQNDPVRLAEQNATVLDMAKKARASVIAMFGVHRYREMIIPFRRRIDLAVKAFPVTQGNPMMVLAALDGIDLTVGLDQDFKRWLLLAAYDAYRDMSGPKLVAVPVGEESSQ